jgi:hypothetical protein
MWKGEQRTTLTVSPRYALNNSIAIAVAVPVSCSQAGATDPSLVDAGYHGIETHDQLAVGVIARCRISAKDRVV